MDFYHKRSLFFKEEESFLYTAQKDILKLYQRTQSIFRGISTWQRLWYMANLRRMIMAYQHKQLNYEIRRKQLEEKMKFCLKKCEEINIPQNLESLQNYLKKEKEKCKKFYKKIKKTLSDLENFKNFS